MDASNTCALVNTRAFTDYNQIVRADTSLVDFDMRSNYVQPRFTTPATKNAFTTFISSSNNFTLGGGKPSLNGKYSIVTGYLGYPIPSGTYKTDFRSTFTEQDTVRNQIITDGNLCSSNDIYSTTVYTGANAATLSLTTLYQTLAASNLNPTDVANIQSNIDRLQNKNKMFYSFFTYEYCYYNSMYDALLNSYFLEYTSLNPVPARFPNIGNLKNSAGASCTTSADIAGQSIRLDAIVIALARVNSRLTDMRSLLTSIQNYYSASLQQSHSILNSSTAAGSDSLTEANIMALKNQSAGVLQAKDESVFRQGIMEYTSEKNRYSNILLGVYAFLNIAIIAVIFNIKE
jgi:hypothetical protein